MLFGFVDGELEVRASKRGGKRIRGRFPYGRTATLSDGGRSGRPRKERFAARAFQHSVESPDQDVFLLSGHDFGKPLASKKAGTLKLANDNEALTFEAEIVPEIMETTYAADMFRQIDAGIVRGLSPGFRIPPARAVEKAEEITEEAIDPARGMHGALIRTIHEAILFELSVVTVAAYDEAEVEARNWQVTDRGVIVPQHPSARWR